MTRLITLRDLDRDWPGRWNLGTAMQLPVPTIHLHHTVTADTGDPIADAAKVHDIDQGRFGKISYSWLVHESSGTWIEGETVHRGAHTINNANQSLNGISFGVGVIGNFHPAAPIPPPRPASDELVALIAAGIREFIVAPGHVSSGFVVDGHRDVYATACCGDSLYDRLPVIRTLISSPPEDEFTMDAEARARFDALDLELKDIRNQIGESNGPVQTGLAGALHKARVAIKKTFAQAGGTGDPEA